MKKHLSKRLLALVLVVALCASFALPVSAAGSGDYDVTFEKVDNDAVSVKPSTLEEFVEPDEPAPYSDGDEVRVSIVLSGESTIEYASGKNILVEDLSDNAVAVNYRSKMEQEQAAVAKAISTQALGGKPLDVVWNITLAANIISANVEYGQIEAIEKVPGVKEVLIETRYEPAVVNASEGADPNMATSSAQIGSSAALAAGYTGAGSRIAVIDTGIDTDHQSFSAAGYEYSLAYRAGLADKTVEEYKAGLDLLDVEEIADVWDQLNASTRGSFAAADVYVSSKIPFGFNYVDKSLDVTHDNDTQGEHGSHVEGIAAANAYIPNGDGTFSNALDAVKVQGVAPDAQIITMKVFGKGGGAYDSDYMVAIEDAVLLGADSVNLSLGSGNPGMSRNSTEAYQTIMDNLANSGVIVAMSAGNAYGWPEYAYNAGYLYSDDVSMQTNGSPGSYTNSLAVASVENDGFTGGYLTVDGTPVFYVETTGYSNEPLATIAGEQEYILIDGFGTAEDWATVGEALAGKVAVCVRGEISFYQKGDYAAEAGAIATIIYNNTAGTINMDLSDYSHTQPCVSVTQEDGAMMMAAATPVTDEEGNVLYYEGTMTISEGIGAVSYDSEYYTMSDFSSWGVPGSLELKPEITAPGGNIYSVNGSVAGGTAYETMSGTSMASPQVAGMAAVVAQYIRENGLEAKTGLSARQLGQSLLMSTAVPLYEEESGWYYSILKQGSGLANVGAAVSAASYILMDDSATVSAADGKVKAELGDDPEKTGTYTVSFSVNNLTDIEQSYDLAADLFTQDVFPYYVNNDGDEGDYMDTWTTPLNATAVWTVDGKTVEPNGAGLANMDFNGDGYVNNDDCTALLEYVTGVRTSISHAENADLDKDGDVDTYDAYLFLNRVNAGAVIVPANGSVNVTVTLTLTDAQKAELNDTYPNGAYVEGFIYVKSVSTPEGVEGTTHSIPVLGFYGNWSDASMFDVGSHAEYATGDEVRIPYLGNTNSNTAAVTYAGDSAAYYFGGNPLIPDDTYMPERNAINSENGDQISKISFIAIRNAAASRYQAKNLTTGEVLAESFPGAVSSAYYYVNGGSWQNTGYSLNTKFTPTGAAEGDQLQVQLTLAPEYYVDAEGNVDWDALGEGASLTVPMVVDNTAPELLDVSVSLTNNTMTVTAKDNQYVAAVALFNNAGTQAYTACGAAQDVDPGETVNYTMSLNGVNGKKFLLQVFDYAMNVTTYKIEMQIGEEVPMPEYIAFDLDNNYWTSFTTSSTYEDLVAYAPSEQTFFAATIVDHIVFACTDGGDLYVMPEDDLTDQTLVANVGDVLTDMAYNKADGKIYGVASGYLVTVDKLTGALGVVGEIGVLTNTLACDANGTFYCNKYGSGEIYSFTLDTLENPQLVVKTNLSSSQYIQTMEINPNNGLLYWNSYYVFSFWGYTFGYSYLYEIDTEAGTYTRYNDLWDELSCLIIPEKTSGGSWTTPTDTVSGIQISQDTLSILRGSSEQLVATVQPWTATDRTVTWTTSDASVATVNAQGVVTAVSAGTCTITATSNLDPSYSASCLVTVTTLDATLKGVLQDENGNPMTFTWDLENAETWTAGIDIDTSIDSATLDTTNGDLYVMDAVTDTWSMHKVDLATGTTSETAANSAGVPLWDMEYSQVFSTEDAPKVGSVYYYYFLSPKDPMNLDAYAFNLSSRLTAAGANYLVAVASLGYEQIEFNGDIYETERFVLLDNAGNLWNYWTYAVGESYSAISQMYSTNLDADFPGYEDDMYCSMIADANGDLYLSAFDGNTNNIYYITIDDDAATARATLIGNVGDTVWPAALYAVEANEAADDGSSVTTIRNAEMVSAESVSASQLAAAKADWNSNTIAYSAVKTVDNSQKDSTAADAETSEAVRATGSLNAVIRTGSSPVRPMSDTVVEDQEDTVILDVTAKNAAGEDVASYNGKLTVNYDSEVFKLESVEVHAAYSSYNAKTEGKVVIAYAGTTEIPAGESVATLVLTRKANGAGSISITHEEVGDDAPGYEELVPINYTEEDHVWGEWKVTTEPTCEDPGVETRTCEKCGETETREIAALGHDYVAVVTAPTCTEQGYTTYTCSRCGDSYVADYVDALGHDWEDWVVTKEATEDEEGEMIRTCKRCGKTETVVVAKLEHVHNLTRVEAVEATCTENGNIEYWYCAKCGSYFDDANAENQIAESDTVVPALGHEWGTPVWNWSSEDGSTVTVTVTFTCEHDASHVETFTPNVTAEILEEALCEEPGVVKYSAEVEFEGETYSEWITHDIPALGHDYQLINVKQPSIFEDGYSGDLVCSRCGDVKEKGHVIPATGVGILPVVPNVPSTITKPTAPMPFTDVSVGDWFYDAVKYVYEEGLMNGTSDTKFSPSATLTRGMVVTILYRLEGKPATRYNARFSDVPDYQWYTDGVEWAVKNGIVNGYGNGKFGPEDPVTREQLTAILYRYAQYKNYSVTKTADLSAYTDSAKVSEYAVPAVKWAAANGILESTNGALRPTESATRAEVAAAVAAFHQKYVK